jgi:hypothetical protein
MSNGRVRRAARLNEERLLPKCLAAEGALGGYPIEIVTDDSTAGLSGPWNCPRYFMSNGLERRASRLNEEGLPP